MEAFTRHPQVHKICGSEVWRHHPKPSSFKYIPAIIVRPRECALFFNYASAPSTSFLSDGSIRIRGRAPDYVKLMPDHRVVLYARLPDGYYKAPVRVTLESHGYRVKPL